MNDKNASELNLDITELDARLEMAHGLPPVAQPDWWIGGGA
jgi:hypothetical protein